MKDQEMVDAEQRGQDKESLKDPTVTAVGKCLETPTCAGGVSVSLVTWIAPPRSPYIFPNNTDMLVNGRLTCKPEARRTLGSQTLQVLSCRYYKLHDIILQSVYHEVTKRFLHCPVYE